jgi:hypothetical protein
MEHYEYEEGEVKSEVVDIGTLATLNKSEIDQQVATAKRWPRSIAKFQKEVIDLVAMNEEVADECIYALPRRDDGEIKSIEGPSARFAEIVASCWGNCRAGARTIDEGQEFVKAQGAFYDLERNVAINYEVSRRITTKSGKRYSADMIGVTSNAACSIALRNAILKGVPKAFWVTAYRAAQKVCAGDIATLGKRRQSSLDALAKKGITHEQVFAALGVNGIEDITTEKLVVLKGIVNAIQNGEISVEEAFAIPEERSRANGVKHATQQRADDLAKKYAPPKTESQVGPADPPTSSGESVVGPTPGEPSTSTEQTPTMAVPPNQEHSSKHSKRVQEPEEGIRLNFGDRSSKHVDRG